MTPPHPSTTSVPAHYLLGLGNPGPKYADTRHNIGFMVLEMLARTLSAQSSPSWEVGRHGLFATHRHTHPDYAFCLVKPLTFVNLSGATIPALARIGIPARKIVIIYDNLDLPLGNIKIKYSGGSGGHNGLKSIIDTIGSVFPRIGIGIGRPQYAGQMEQYVLSTPPEEERTVLREAVRRVCHSFFEHPTHTLEQRMEYLHRRVP